MKNMLMSVVYSQEIQGEPEIRGREGQACLGCRAPAATVEVVSIKEGMCSLSVWEFSAGQGGSPGHQEERDGASCHILVP